MARVLMVDDDETLLQVIADYLESRGHQVSRCGDPTSAAELAEKTAPDLAIVDYEMPRLTGTQLLTELRSGGRTHFLPVLFLSGVEPLLYTSQIAPDPRVRFLRKPVDFDELDGAIAALLDPEGWSKNA
jgi:twitching motility two-component system response regulator PilH/chemosensory pili system protein ChpA (sensor histidine kinase/response regulator)